MGLDRWPALCSSLLATGRGSLGKKVSVAASVGRSSPLTEKRTPLRTIVTRKFFLGTRPPFSLPILLSRSANALTSPSLHHRLGNTKNTNRRHASGGAEKMCVGGNGHSKKHNRAKHATVSLRLFLFSSSFHSDRTSVRQATA